MLNLSNAPMVEAKTSSETTLDLTSRICTFDFYYRPWLTHG